MQVERRAYRVRALAWCSCGEASGLPRSLRAVGATDAAETRVELRLLIRVAARAGDACLDPVCCQLAEKITRVRNDARVQRAERRHHFRRRPNQNTIPPATRTRASISSRTVFVMSAGTHPTTY